jgi:excinuclease ABC subunit C
MYGNGGELLYVGKARNLRARVAAYTKFGGHTQRIARMISLTRSMEFVVTASDGEALLLEANLIKRLKPRFNIILRDDKSFPYILIRKDHTAPQALKHRGARRAKGRYFGPFASAHAVDSTLDTLQRAFHLRTCADSVFAARSRPCMLHQMGRCSAPCTGVIAENDYLALVEQAEAFLDGAGDDLMSALATQMDAAAIALDFEAAAKLRDRIRALAAVRARQSVNPDGLAEADVFAIETQAGQSCVQAFFFRAGQNWGATAYYPRHDADDTPEAVLSAFISQFYDDRPAPKLVLTSHPPAEAELLREALSFRAGRGVEVRTPARGDKKEIVEQALVNAREALARRLADTQSQSRSLAALAQLLGMDKPIRRIEVYDNSHIQGSHAIGGMIVAGENGFERSAYRTFNMKGEQLAPGDDYAMMREMLTRRFQRLQKPPASGEPSPDWPDLVIIDGGAGQLSSVVTALSEIGVTPDHVEILAIAKGPDRNAGREHFFRPGRPSFMLPPSDPALYYLQRLRDEAHRWAILTHRSRRTAQTTRSPLDDIEGIGPARKKALLHRFGSARAVADAQIADLMEVDGVSEAMARRIRDHFHPA